MSFWTDERIEVLRRMWAAGDSAAQISRALSGSTRSSVIGKLHRLGLQRSEAAQRASMSGAHVNRAPRAPSVPRDPNAAAGLNMRGAQSGKVAVVHGALPVSEPKAPFHDVRLEKFAPLPGSNPRPFTERPFDGCSWPVGEDGDGIMLSCCELVSSADIEAGGRRWCSVHRQIGRAKVQPGKSPTSSNSMMRSLRRHLG